MLQSNYAINYLNKKIDLLKSNLNAESFWCGSFLTADVFERVMQAVCYYINGQLSYILQHDVEGLETYDYEYFSWSIKKGQIIPHRKKLIFLMMKACYRWGLNLIRFSTLLFKKGSIEVLEPVSLITQVGGRFLVVDGSVDSFEQFLDNCPLEPLQGNQKIFVGGDINKVQNRIVASKSPFSALLEINEINFIDKLLLILLHFKNLFLMLSLPFVNFNMIMLSRDFIDMAIIEMLNRKGLLKDLMFLHSLSGTVPIWASFLPERTFRSHMVWYSVNSRPLLFKDQPVVVHQPIFKFNQFDVHWVWTDEEKRWVSDCQDKPVNAVACGPILFGQDSDVEPEKSLVRKILLFDTPPHEKDFIISSDSYLNYVNLDVSINLIKDTISAVEKVERKTGEKIEVLLKPKKAIGRKGMIPEYFDYLYMLIEKKRLTVLPLTHNIAEIISSTDCLIAHPFSTSTKYAHHIGKTGVHYDPTGRVLDDPYDGGETILLSGRNDLERFIEKFYE